MFTKDVRCTNVFAKWYSNSNPIKGENDLKNTQKYVNEDNESMYVLIKAELGRYTAHLITPIRDIKSDSLHSLRLRELRLRKCFFASTT